MTNQDQRAVCSAVIRGLQFEAGHFAVSSAYLLAFVLVLDLIGNYPPAIGTPILTYSAIAFSAAMLVTRAIVPSRVTTGGRPMIARGEWLTYGSRISWTKSDCTDPAGDANALVQLFRTKIDARTAHGVCLLRGRRS